MIIGSCAMKHWFPEFNRVPKDIDIAIKEQSVFNGPKTIDGKRVEYLINPILIEYYGDLDYIPVEGLLTLKMSHLFWDINWEKHMFDVQFLIKNGIEFNTILFYKLYNYWNVIHKKNKRSKLDMSAAEFFDNAVKCPYDHDWLHSLINNPPTYTKVLKDGAEVDVSSEKFYSLSFEEKCSLVREEIYIMAFERFGEMYYRRAYSRMMKKFIMGHAPLWEALFIIQNYSHLNQPKFDFLTFLNEKVSC